MNVIDINEKLLEIFKDIFDFQSAELSDKLTPEDIAEWDSINHITLMMEVQAEFGIVFTTMDIKVIRSVGDLQNAIHRHLA
jgi:acyl carrier protein